MTPEGRVKKGIKKTIEQFEADTGIDVYTEWPVPGGYGKSGLDMIGGICGVMFLIEAKAPLEEPTPRQIETIAKAERSLIKWFVIDEERGPQHTALLKWLYRFTLGG